MMTREEWDAASWRYRLEYIQDAYGYATAAQLSQDIFGGKISAGTIRCWKAGSKVPGKEVTFVLRKYAMGDTVEETEDSACRTLILDATMDSASSVIGFALARKDPRQMSCILHCIASKLASIATASTQKLLVCRFESMLGRFPFSETVTFINPSDKRIKATAEISHGDGIDAIVTVTINLYSGSKSMSKTIMQANDYGISRAAAIIVQFLCK